jgi:tetratricopeptide (TPR) repeat protein
MKNLMKLFVVTLCMVLITGCTKEFLNKKPDKALVVPSTLKDFQAILDNSYGVFGNTTYLTQIADGDFEVMETGIASLNFDLRNSYLWEKDIFEGVQTGDWNKPYEQVFYANIVIEGLDKVNKTDENKHHYDQIKGSALFFRGHAMAQLVQQFAAPYNSEAANEILGLPIRTSSDVNVKSKRGTLAEVYEHILNDLIASINLLPENGQPKSRPGKVAAWALLARIYLVMGEYDKATEASSAALAIQSELINYNDLDTNANTSFPDGRFVYNDEIIYYTNQTFTTFFNSASVVVSEELYNLYDDNDLRKQVFYKANRGFKGSYGGSPFFIFTGLATDELYLIRAECYVRLGNLKDAMADLNTLMRTRWKNTEAIQFEPFIANTETEALTMILEERRKELLTRGLRWSDLRRLNTEQRFQVTLERTYQGETYILLPNDVRYTFPIPQVEIEGSGIEQNER